MAERDLKTTAITSLFWKFFEQGGTAVVTLGADVADETLKAAVEAKDYEVKEIA